MAYQGGQIKSVAGFYIKAVEENYQEDIDSGIIKQKKREQQLKETATAAEEKRRHDELRVDYSKYKLAFITEKLALLEAKERNSLISNFNKIVQEGKPSLIGRWVENDKITIPLLSDFIGYANSHFPKLLSEILSIDNYKTA